MTACPTCGHDPDRRFKNELEMQHPTRAAELQRAADACGEDPQAIGYGCVGWRGLVWDRVTLRKPSVCIRTAKPLAAGAPAWRQLSEVKNRNHRVADDAWGVMASDPEEPAQLELI